MVTVSDLTYAYSGGKYVLDGVSFELEAGKCLAVLGTNGAGKSTMLTCIDCICHAEKGLATVSGRNIFTMDNKTRAQHIAYVPQSIDAVSMTVFDAVLLGRKPYIRWEAGTKDCEVVSRIIHQLGLDKYILRPVSELSGGEAQKVLIARALAQEPDLLLLDEPTSSLDLYNQHEVLQLIRKVVRFQNICALIIIHDLNLAARYCDYFLFLKDAHVYAYGSSEIFTAHTIHQVYGIKADVITHNNIPVIIPFPDTQKECNV